MWLLFHAGSKTTHKQPQTLWEQAQAATDIVGTELKSDPHQPDYSAHRLK